MKQTDVTDMCLFANQLVGSAYMDGLQFDQEFEVVLTVVKFRKLKHSAANLERFL